MTPKCYKLIEWNEHHATVWRYSETEVAEFCLMSIRRMTYRLIPILDDHLKFQLFVTIPLKDKIKVKSTS